MPSRTYRAKPRGSADKNGAFLPRPLTAKISATCPHCDGDIWFTRPSGAIYCAACGATYQPAPITPPRP